MDNSIFIATETLCLHYDIEVSFVEDLGNIGLIQIETIDQSRCIHQDQISELEKIIRLHQELKLNLEGIDVVLNLLEKERALRDEIQTLKSKLLLYENQ